MNTYTVPFLVEHERGNGPTSVSAIAGLATNTDSSLANTELVLSAEDSMGRRRHVGVVMVRGR